jgi:two-component system sensor histidine kinase BaeS
MNPRPIRPQPIRRRLILSYLAVLIFGMGLAGLLTWRSVEQLALDTQRENMLAQARLTAAALQGQPLPAEQSQPYAQTTNILPGIHTRLLSEQGVVVVSLPILAGEVAAPPAENSGAISPETLLLRPEIKQAMQGEAASAVRRIANRRVLYAAAPITGEDGSVSGLVYLATPLPAGGLPFRLALELAGAGVLGIGLAFAAGTLISRRISRPVEDIALAAAAVSTGDLGQKISAVSEISELNGMAQAFNKMTANLRQSDQAKNAFVADVTHELRTPLTVIKGTIETLEDGAMDDMEGRTALLTSMQRETDRLIRLVNDLLVLTRADAGMLRLNLRPVDLSELAHSRCDIFSAFAKSREVGFCVKSSEQAFVLADGDRLAQVLDNLLDNALRYSPEGTVVNVEISSSGVVIQCEVRDSGPGIAKEHLPFIFQRFYRAESSRDRQTGGAGLGLAIAQSLVLAQGGSISASSVIGEGTSLRFNLPAATRLTKT